MILHVYFMLCLQPLYFLLQLKDALGNPLRWCILNPHETFLSFMGPNFISFFRRQVQLLKIQCHKYINSWFQKVCRLNNSLYGLKQAPRACYEKIDSLSLVVLALAILILFSKEKNFIFDIFGERNQNINWLVFYNLCQSLQSLLPSFKIYLAQKNLIQISRQRQPPILLYRNLK